MKQREIALTYLNTKLSLEVRSPMCVATTALVGEIVADVLHDLMQRLCNVVMRVQKEAAVRQLDMLQAENVQVCREVCYCLLSQYCYDVSHMPRCHVIREATYFKNVLSSDIATC